MARYSITFSHPTLFITCDWTTRFGNSSDTFVKTFRVLALFLIGRQKSETLQVLVFREKFLALALFLIGRQDSETLRKRSWKRS